MKDTVEENTMIERPDGSFIPYAKLPPEKQIEHDVVTKWCALAEDQSQELAKFKHDAIADLIAARVMMLQDYGVKRGGKEGNLTLRSACGRLMVKMSVSKHISFGPELEAAKALIFEFLEDELDKGGSEFIRDIVVNVFKLNAKGRIDTGGILGLRQHRFENDTWKKAMDAIDAAVCHDAETTYVNFYRVALDETGKIESEDRIALDLAKV